VNKTFTHPLWQRAWIVDASGVHEQRRGREFVSIPWEELRYVTIEAIRSVRGTRIAPRLTLQKRRELVSAVTHEWQRLYPERELEHRRWLRRRGAHAAYIWLPVLTLTPSIGFYIWAWYLGWPAYLTPHLQKMNRITIVGFVSVICFAVYYAYTTRKVD
jgi:hypothetical protein